MCVQMNCRTASAKKNAGNSSVAKYLFLGSFWRGMPKKARVEICACGFTYDGDPNRRAGCIGAHLRHSREAGKTVCRDLALPVDDR
jgi:hypothetical protein